MIRRRRRRGEVVKHVIILLAAFGLVSACMAPDEVESGGDVLILYGAISRADRGPLDPVAEPVFERFGIEFDDALALSYGSLAAYEQVRIDAYFPEDGPRRRFEGPRLSTLIAEAGGEGRAVRLIALDGYQRTIAMDRITAFEPILAIRRDGAPLSLGGWGPAMLVWPRDSHPQLSTMPDDDWIYGVIAIEILAGEDAAP